MLNLQNHMHDAARIDRGPAREENDEWELFLRKHSRLIWQSIQRTFRAVSFYHERGDIEDAYRLIFRSLLEHNFNKTHYFYSSNARTLCTWLMVVSSHHTINHVRYDSRQALRKMGHQADHEASVIIYEMYSSFFKIAAYLEGRLSVSDKVTIDQYLREHPEHRSTIAVIRRVLFDRNLDHAEVAFPLHLIDKKLPSMVALLPYA